jgi:hypothetical protein
MTPVVRKKSAIPIPAFVAALIVAGVALAGVIFVIGHHPGDVFPLVLLLAIGPLFLGGYVLLIGYVYQDAKSRGMRYVMWTWLAILVPNGIGIILYFLLRDPYPVFCSACGAPAKAGFAYCSRCGVGMAPACPKCHKVCESGWTHCPYCGTNL